MDLEAEIKERISKIISNCIAISISQHGMMSVSDIGQKASDEILAHMGLLSSSTILTWDLLRHSGDDRLYNYTLSQNATALVRDGISKGIFKSTIENFGYKGEKHTLSIPVFMVNKNDFKS